MKQAIKNVLIVVVDPFHTTFEEVINDDKAFFDKFRVLSRVYFWNDLMEFVRKLLSYKVQQFNALRRKKTIKVFE